MHTITCACPDACVDKILHDTDMDIRVLVIQELKFKIVISSPWHHNYVLAYLCKTCFRNLHIIYVKLLIYVKHTSCNLHIIKLLHII
jgi:hypothetical protein